MHALLSKFIFHMISLSEVTLAIVRGWITWLHIAFYNVGMVIILHTSTIS